MPKQNFQTSDTPQKTESFRFLHTTHAIRIRFVPWTLNYSGFFLYKNDYHLQIYLNEKSNSPPPPPHLALPLPLSIHLSPPIANPGYPTSLYQYKQIEDLFFFSSLLFYFYLRLAKCT